MPNTFRKSVPLPVNPNPIILEWGQSNTPGQAVQSFPATVSNVPYYCRCQDEKLGRPGFWDPCGAYTRDQAVPASIINLIATTGVKHGFQPQCATALLQAGLSPVFVATARSGTALSPNWDPGGTGRAFMAQTYAEVFASGLPAKRAHIVTFHGEQDAGIGTSQSAYLSQYTSIIAFIRTFFPGSRVYCGRLNSNFTGATGPQIAAIQAAQDAFVAGDHNAETITPDSWGYVSPHFTSTGWTTGASVIAPRIIANI